MAQAKKTARARTNSKTDETLIVIEVDGDSYNLRPGEITGRIAGKVRRATGVSFRAAIEALTEDPDLDALAALIYAAALQEDPDASYDEVADGLSYGSEIDVRIGSQEDDDEGEA